MLDLTDCNPAQREAVMSGEGPLLVLAGPGSGKTFTITKRILWLLQEKKTAPEKILVVTFTKEAALSMKQRFTQVSPQTTTVNFGTFHSIFYQILLKSGRIQPGNILNDRQKRNLIFPILKQQKDCQKISTGELTDLAKSFLAAISYYKNTEDTVKSKEKLSGEWKAYFAQVYATYEDVRRRIRGWDFDDMLQECETFLQGDPAGRAYWQNRFSHILIDEFQDINDRQYNIIRILAERHGNVFAVGDDDQAIYGFRGSRPACMKQFVQDFGARQILLGTNYRSRQEIVEASLLVINENKDRFPKELEPCESNRFKRTEIGGVEHSVNIREFREPTEQLQYLTDCLKNRPAGENCAVLFRTNLAMQSVAARLAREGIPFCMKEKGRNIYEHFIVQDLMAYLRIAQGSAERSDYFRVVNKPFRNISREAFGEEISLRALEHYYTETLRGIPGEYIEKARTAVRLWIRQMEFVKNADLKLAVTFLRKACGYERYLTLRARQGQEEQLQEWLEILDWITEDAGHYQNLWEWQEAQMAFGDELQKQGQNREREAEEHQNNKNSKTEEIRLLTVHASKGLEFDRVWIPDCNEKTFPHGDVHDPEHCEEERRIFYVAMTRAKKNLELLCLTGTGERPRFPSRFLIPLRRYRR